MKATEMFVEQLLVGLLVVFTGFFLFGDIDAVNGYVTESSNGVVKDFVFGFLIVGGAYLIGIVYDRCADTLLQDIDQHHRIRCAIGRLPSKKYYEIMDSAEDPYPEQKIRMHMMAKGQGVLQYEGYLRSRIRLTRAMTTLMPALTFLLMLKAANLNSYAQKLPYGWFIVAIYATVLAIKSNLFGTVTRWLPKNNVFYNPPRTSDVKCLKLYIEKHLKKESDADGIETFKINPARKDILCEPTYWALVAIITGEIIFAYYYYEIKGINNPLLVLYPFLSTILTLIVGWSWLRISKTYVDLVKRYWQSLKNGSLTLE